MRKQLAGLAFFFCIIALTLFPSHGYAVEIASEPVEQPLSLVVTRVQGEVSLLRHEIDSPGSLDPKPLSGGETFSRFFECSTGESGQAVLNVGASLEIRLKEDSTLTWDGKTTFSISAGMIGFRLRDNASAGIMVLTPQSIAELVSPGGILVAKPGPILTRIGVLKGKVQVTGPVGDTEVILGSRQEIAAGEEELSLPYGCLDDLYFAWYWDKPAF